MSSRTEAAANAEHWKRDPAIVPVLATRTRYRKRPMLVDAVLWQGDPVVFRAWMDELGSLPFTFSTDSPDPRVSLVIETISGEPISVLTGEWIIRGAKGEFYPCDPGVFAETYDPVEVELVPTPEGMSAFFSGNFDALTAKEFREKFPPVEREAGAPEDVFTNDESRGWAVAMRVSAEVARSRGYEMVCVECGRGMPGGEHRVGCPLAADAPTEQIKAVSAPTCSECDTELWVTAETSGCPNPRCVAYVPIPRPRDGSSYRSGEPWPAASSEGAGR